jgi:acyl-CoA thioesterase FadM
MGHVNNVQYIRYAESGRTNWTRNFGRYFDTQHQKQWDEMLTSKAVGMILKSITVDFKFPMTWPDRITVCHKLRSKPDDTTDNMVLDVCIMSERMQRPAARCLEDVVVYNYRTGKKSGMPGFMLEQFNNVWELQESEKAASTKKVEELLRDVRELETGTWDREGAVER